MKIYKKGLTTQPLSCIVKITKGKEIKTMKIRLSVIIKNIIRRIFCKHEYKWDCSVIASHKNCEEPYDLVYLDLVCKKCGKTKSIKYTKPLDSNVG